MLAVSTKTFRCSMLLVALAASRMIIGVTIPTNADGAFGRTVVTLRSVVRVDSPVLRIEDVAEVTGGDPKLRDRLAALDLEDAPARGEEIEITPPQLEFRLRLAGIDVRQVSIRGSAVRIAKGVAGASAEEKALKSAADSRSHAHRFSAKPALANGSSATESKIERVVLEAAKKVIQPRLSWPEEDLVIQLAQPLPRELRDSVAVEGASCWAELRTAGMPSGRVPLRVSVEAPGQRTLECPVQFDVRHFDSVVVASKAISQGQSVTAADLVVDRQDTTQLVSYLSSPTALIGLKAKRNIAAGQLVRPTDADAETRSTQPPLVKRRDRVKVVARSGVLNVSIAGESLQDGRAGDVIKVRNVDSNTTVHGRVVSATEVEVVD